MKVAVLKYNAGNVLSVCNALKRLNILAEVSDDPAAIRKADRVIFPGVGEAGSALRYLHGRGLDELLTNLTQPVLGICLGLQLLCRHSAEGDTRCLGIVPADVRRFPGGLKVPHIGWNSIHGCRGDLFAGIDEGAFVYFVHSYFAELGEFSVARCNYGVDFSAAVACRNFYAVQFHPEKSGATGAQILGNFLKL